MGTKIYVPGGFNSVDFTGPLDNMQIYDTTSDSWSQGAPLPAARSGVATAAINGRVYVIGGYNPVGTGHPSVQIYDPVTHDYTTGASMPAGQGNMPAVLLAGEMYVVGGGTAPGARYAYNPTTNSWRTIAALPTTGGTCQSSNGFVLDGELWDRRLPGPAACSAGVDEQHGERQLARRAAVQRRSPGTRQHAVQRPGLRRWRWQRIRWLDGGRVDRATTSATTPATTPATTSAAATTTASASATATASASARLHRHRLRLHRLRPHRRPAVACRT